MKKILLIDDSDTYTWCLQKYLQHRGYPVKTACTLKEARAAIQEEMPLVVCCDLDLPDGSGMDFLDEVRAADKELPFILASCHDKDDYKDKEYHYYYCPTGKKNGCTSSVMLKESDLIECVQDSLKGHIENVASLDALLSSISQERINRELAQEYAAQIRVNEKRVAQTEGFKAKLYENLVSGILTKEEFLSYKRKYNADIELFQKAIAEWNDKLTDVLENRSERNRWINHFMRFSTMEDIDRRAVMQLIRSIRVMGKDELHIEFNYQDEYQKAISLAEQIATKNEERMVG